MDVTLSQLFREYELFKRVKAVTKDKARAAFRHLVEFLGDAVASQVSTAAVNRWATWLATEAVNARTGQKGLSDYTIKTTVGAASQVFGWALRQRGVDGISEYGIRSNPFADADPVKVDEREIRTYTSEQASLLVAAAGEMEWRDPTKTLAWCGAILLGLDAGWRRGEIQNARWDDIDLDAGRVTVQRRPDKPGEYWSWMAKGKRERSEPMSDVLWATLIRLREVRPWRYPFLSLGRYRSLLARPWPLPEEVRDCPVNNWTRNFKRIVDAACLKTQDAAGFHMLRKTYGTWLADNNVPLHETQLMLGHQSSSTTLKHYIGINQRKCEEAVRAAINARKY